MDYTYAGNIKGNWIILSFYENGESVNKGSYEF